MPTRLLPDDPSFEHLKKEAKRLHKAVRAGEADALAQVAEHHSHAGRATTPFSLADAQHVVARSYGFASWTRLKQFLATVERFARKPPARGARQRLLDVFIGLAVLDYGEWHQSNPEKAQRLLDEHPELARADVYSATTVGDVETVRAMLDRDPALVNARGGSLNWEPILYACYTRMADRPSTSTLDVARLLLARGADPNAGFLWDGRYLFTALTGAFGEGEDGSNNPPHPHRDALARMLLDAGADPNDSQTLYNRHFRADDDHLRLLFEYGLGKNRGGPWFKRLADRATSPSRMLVEELWSAAKNNRPARIRLLIEHGVDVNTPGLRDGRTPYEVAVREGNDAIADYLLAHGAKTVALDRKERFAIACIEGNRAAALALLAEDPALMEKLGHHGRVDLMHRAVAKSGRPEGIRLCVELGADINGLVPNTGLDRAVLHNAAMHGSVEGIQLLLDLGADPHLHDPTYGSTPIGWAYHSGQHEAVNYLARFATIFDALRCDAIDRVAELLAADPAQANAVDEEGTPLVFYLHPQLSRLDDLLAMLRSHGCNVNARHPKGMTLLDVAVARGLVEFADVLRRHGLRTTEEQGVP